MKKNLLLFITLLLYLTSCQKEDVAISNPPQEFQPNGNEILTIEKLIGEDKRHSSFEKVIDDGLGNFYFTGYINEQDVIGKVDKQGFVIWQQSLNFEVSEITLFYGTGSLEKSALIIGKDGNSAVIAIYDRNGTKLSDAYFNDFTISFFNDVRYRHEANNYYLCSAIGGAGNNENDIAPYWVNFTINTNGQISKSIPNVNLSTQIRLTQYPRIRFNKFATGLFEGSSGQGGGGIPNSRINTLDTYVSYRELNTEGTTISAGVLAFNDKVTFRPIGIVTSVGDVLNTSLEIKWQRSIGGQAPNTPIYLGKSVVIGNDITVVGSVMTKEGKVNNISSNGLSAAKIVMLDKRDGNIISNREFSISQYNDIVTNLSLIIGGVTQIYDDNGNLVGEEVTDGGIYICGTVSNYTKDLDYFYGYGWVAEISNGSLSKNRYFGFPTGRHSFNSLVLTGQDIYAFGFKDYYKKDGGHKAWFAQINRNRL